MNKKLFCLLLFSVNIIILICCFINLEHGSLFRLLTTVIISGWLLILTINNYLKNNKILDNKHYLYLLFIVNILVSIIILRNFFDPLMPVKTLNEVNGFGVFLNYNLLYISLMYAGLLIYNLINEKEKK